MLPYGNRFRPEPLLWTLILALGSVSCWTAEQPDGPPSTRGRSTATSIPSPTEAPLSRDASLPRLALVQVASVRNAVALAFRTGFPTLYIASRGGRVWRLGDTPSDEELAIDLSPQVSCCEGEQGMFGLLFSPDGSKMYVSFTDRGGDLRVSEFSVGDGRVPKASQRDLLVIQQPSVRHHGGSLAFGPDGYLYIGVGDGSLGSDPTGEGQSLASLRGKLLRIDPEPSGRRPYRIPVSNPFVDTQGARAEIFAYGLRNPWRISFDRATGDLWIGDVGQYRVEEIDYLPAGSASGANLGWNRMEGSLRFTGPPPRGHVGPIHEYRHDARHCAVIGGYVYRGMRIPSLTGAYLYADLCEGRVRALVQVDGEVRRTLALDVGVDATVSFGEDSLGEIYLLTLLRGVHRLEPAL